MEDQQPRETLKDIRDRLNNIEHQLSISRRSRTVDLKVSMSISFFGLALALLLGASTQTGPTHEALYKSGIVFLLLIAPILLFNVSRSLSSIGVAITFTGILIYAATDNISSWGITIYFVGSVYMIIVYALVSLRQPFAKRPTQQSVSKADKLASNHFVLFATAMILAGSIISIITRHRTASSTRSNDSFQIDKRDMMVLVPTFFIASGYILEVGTQRSDGLLLVIGVGFILFALFALISAFVTIPLSILNIIYEIAATLGIVTWLAFILDWLQHMNNILDLHANHFVMHLFFYSGIVIVTGLYVNQLINVLRIGRRQFGNRRKGPDQSG